MRHTAHIAIGSNLGDKAENCRAAVRAFAADKEFRLLGASRLYQTEPVDFTDQAWFVNVVVKIATGLAPEPLLSRLQALQRGAGRAPGGRRFGPRVLDLDILLFDQLILDSPTLSIPHPRMHLRRFVLIPLCDIDPGVMHPLLKRDVRSLLDELDSAGQEVVELR